MIHFFRDILDGPIYIVVVIISIIFIMAIIGFIMEKKRLALEEKKRIAVISNETPVTPISSSNINTSVANTFSNTINPTIISSIPTMNTTTKEPETVPKTSGPAFNPNSVVVPNPNSSENVLPSNPDPMIGSVNFTSSQTPYVIDNSAEIKVEQPIIIPNNIDFATPKPMPVEITQPTPIIISDDIDS